LRNMKQAYEICSLKKKKTDQQQYSIGKDKRTKLLFTFFLLRLLRPSRAVHDSSKVVRSNLSLSACSVYYITTLLGRNHRTDLSACIPP
jgi:hypothetical protein